METKSRTPNTPTTSSFATSPITVATVAWALSKPSGANIHLIPFPSIPSTLFSSSISTSNPNLPPTAPNLDPAQITIVARRMMVPAFLIKEAPRSHILRNTLETVGIWYAGSSITKGAGSPANIRVFFKIMPEQIIAAIPTKYALGATHQALPNSAAEIRAIIGSFAPHGIKVVVIIVILRSRSFSIVLDAIIPGTPQPVPINIGIKDFPESPNLRKMRSIIKAMRAI